MSTFYEYPPEVRKIIYTTNMIEGLNRQFRQITKNKPSFTSDDSLRRMLYEPFPVWWTVKMEKKQNETEDILRYLT